MAIPYVTEEMKRARHAEYIRRRIEEEKRRLREFQNNIYTAPAPIFISDPGHRHVVDPASIPTPHIDRALAEVSPPESENDRIWRLLTDAARGT